MWSLWERGLPLGSIAGIPVRLHVLFLALLGLQVAAGALVNRYVALYWFIILGPMLLATVLIHELGHCLAARWVGSSVHGILLWPLGGLAFIGHTSGPKADLWVAAAGPLTHVPQVLLYVLCLLPVHKKNFGDTHISLRIPNPRHYMDEAVLVGGLLMNIAMFVFNLLVPAYPLDGGRMLVDMLLLCGLRPVPTAWVSIGLSVPLSLAIIIYGGLIFNIVLLLIGLWILFSALQLYDTVRKGEVHNHPLFADVCQHSAPHSANTYQQQAPMPNYV